MNFKLLLKVSAALAAVALLGLCGLYAWHELKQENSLIAEARTEAPGRFVELAGGTVHYQLAGPETAETVLFIHGGGITGAEVWKENLPFFARQGYRTIAYDLYGRGYSDRPGVANSPELFLGQLVQLLDTLRIKTRVNVVALSMGAIVALDFASHYPHRVRKLVLIDPAASGNYRPNVLLTIPVISDFLMTIYWYPRAVENQRKEFVNQELFNEYSARLSYFMDFEGYKHTNYSTWMNMLNQDKVALVRKVPAGKLMLVYGDKDPYFNEKQNDRYRSFAPGARLLKVEDAGHMPNMEKPEVVNAAILDFLRETSIAETVGTGGE